MDVNISLLILPTSDTHKRAESVVTLEMFSGELTSRYAHRLVVVS